MASNKALEVKAQASVDGQNIHPTEMKLINSINHIAQGKVTYIHKTSDANKQATDITSKDIFAAMAERQTKSFNDTPDSPGIDMTMTDAFNNSLSFKGNTSAPSYSFSAGDVALTEDVQPDYAVLNCLDLSIYNFIEYDLDILKDSDYPSNIAEFIKKVFERIIEVGKKYIDDSSQGKITKECSKKQHEINEKVKKFAIQLFDNSKETIGWDGVKDQLGTAGVDSLKRRICGALKSNAGGFFNNILHLAEEFQCVYVPEFDNVGKLVNKKKLFESDESLDVKSISLSVRAGSVGMFPIRAVAVRRVGSYAGDLDIIGDNNDYGVIYPKEVKPGGSIMQILGPQWLPAVHFNFAKVKPINNGESAITIQNNKLEPKSGKNATPVVKQAEQQNKDNDTVVEQWAETVYYWQALGQSYAIVNTELKLNAKVGTRYTVTGKDGALFSGVLNAVEHTISTGYNDCKAHSNLQFSHVIIEGATIPGID